MILVDTNVWIYSAGSRHPQITQQLRDLLLNGEVLGHDFVYAELLLIPGGPARNQIVARYPDLEQLPSMPKSEFFTFIEKRALSGKGLSMVDAHLLASAHKGGARLWTEEKALKTQAAAMGIAY